MKNTNDYDSVFKTLKSKHKRLFIPVINEMFGKNYPLDAKSELLPTEGYFAEEETSTGEKKVEERIADFLLKLGNEVFLLECQSYDDDSMAIRIAEYAFITAKKVSVWDIGKATIPMPHFLVIYVKKTNRTPERTEITFTFPDGQKVIYQADNVLLADITKEYIIEKRLFPYIPFYIARYEMELAGEKGCSQAMEDLAYFREEMIGLYESGELSARELLDLMGFVNTIITHITDGNKVEERLVKVMGGVILETESERLLRVGREEGEARGEARGREEGIRSVVELCQEVNLSIADTVEKLVSKFGLSEQVSMAKANQYWKS